MSILNKIVLVETFFLDILFENDKIVLTET